MTTIFNQSFPEKPITQGLVEIIDVYGGNYFTLAVDGQIIGNIYKDSYQFYVLKRSFIKQCVEFSGVTEDQLTFVYINWYVWGYSRIEDYDSNTYLDDYQQFISAMKNTNQSPAQYIQILATGIDELEEKI